MNRAALAVGLTALLGLFAVNASAQHGSIMGKVLDQDGKPVEDAVVQVSSPTGATAPLTGKTNGKGEFGIATSQTPGPWDLTILKPGFAAYKHSEQIRATLGGVPVNLGTIKLMPPTAGSKRVVTQEELAKMQAENKALQAQFKQAVQLTEEAETASAAGDSATASAKYDQALTTYNEMLAKNPDIAELHHNIGYVLGRTKKWAESAEAYAKAAKMKPDMAGDYASAAVGYANSNQRDKAIEILNEGVKENPTNARLLVSLGEFYYNGAQYPEATVALKKAQELDPTSADPLYFLGMIAVSQGRTQECIALLEKYLSLGPTNTNSVQAAKGVLSALKPAKK